jgi:hypothetical protein
MLKDPEMDVSLLSEHYIIVGLKSLRSLMLLHYHTMVVALQKEEEYNIKSVIEGLDLNS